MNLHTIKSDGTKGDAIKVDNGVFKIKPNEAVVHQAVVQELHNQRQGTHSAKSRGMVKGGGRKPWRQKGRGVARAGTIRSPLWKGGGTVFGPEPHPYKKRMPKKMKQLARKSVLSHKAGKGEIFIVDDLTQPDPKTSAFYKFLISLNIQNKKVLVLPEKVEKNLRLAVRNLPNVNITKADSASTYELINHEVLLFDKPGLVLVNQKLSS
ncbi:MAG: 50S ribosomal protein L4 [Candidatus Marinimicrobia bacterium]|jgi:large subunit ribosomal protein L4|nr:50S ribosomal protein L4 [Candidatus Neomarinimicrobiota bacterium]MDP7037318.1 50S ribosomal protein L4 [Candidatus Neomarinimicrobiota bacterium]